MTAAVTTFFPIVSPDPYANPYLAFALIIYAGLYGIENKLLPPDSADVNMYTASEDTKSRYKNLPQSLGAAGKAALESSFINSHLPRKLVETYCKQ